MRAAAFAGDGEAFDKPARMLNLGYPGGPFVDTCARNRADSGGTRVGPVFCGYEFPAHGLSLVLVIPNNIYIVIGMYTLFRFGKFLGKGWAACGTLGVVVGNAFQ